MSENPEDIRLQRSAVEQTEALIALGRFEQAKRHIGLAIAQDPEDSHLRVRFAYILQQLGDLEAALEQAHTAVHLDPNNDMAHMRLAWILFALKQFAPALEHARSAVKIDPEFVYNLYALAVCERQNGNYKRARDAAAQAIQLDPENSDLYVLNGDLAFKCEDSKASEKFYREALRHDPESADAHFSLAQALEAQTRNYEAADLYYSAVKLDPSNRQYQDHLFSILHHDLIANDGKSKEAVLRQFSPEVRHFYEARLSGGTWIKRLRMTSVMAIWVLILLLLTIGMSMLKGQALNKLYPFVWFVVGMFLLSFFTRMWLMLRNKRNLLRNR